LGLEAWGWRLGAGGWRLEAGGWKVGTLGRSNKFAVVRGFRARRKVSCSAALQGCLTAAVLTLIVYANAAGQEQRGQAPPTPPPAGQGQRGGPPAPPRPAKAAAPIDLTGYWVSVVSEDWRWRMVTPAKGDYASVPTNADARKAADAWDPAKDEAAGEQCKSYGAAAIMRVPGRLNITWQDDNT
jgi:hypothetical protein